MSQLEVKKTIVLSESTYNKLKGLCSSKDDTFDSIVSKVLDQVKEQNR